MDGEAETMSVAMPGDNHSINIPERFPGLLAKLYASQGHTARSAIAEFPV
jgi:hypothetical protein